MDTLKKIGLTALGTTLVAGSAFAGEITASGDAGFTWSSEDTTGATNDGIAHNHDITFSGSGELDNGWTVNTTMILVEGATLSSSNVKLTMGSAGSIKVGSGTGSIGASFDNVVPTAWEENHDGMATSTAIDNMGAGQDAGVIDYTAPAMDIMGATVTAMFAWSPEADSAAGEGGVSAGDNGDYSTGTAAGVTIGYGGLSLGAFGAQMQADTNTGVRDVGTEADSFDGTWYAKYAMGPVSIGYQVAYIDRGQAGASAANNSSAKTVTAASGHFDSESISVAFNINENFSVSWSELTETYDEGDDGTVGDVDLESTSIQFAYTMGSMSIKGYQTDEDKPGWDSDATSNETTEIAVNFAF